jgi:hypothetical protein
MTLEQLSKAHTFEQVHDLIDTYALSVSHFGISRKLKGCDTDNLYYLMTTFNRRYTCNHFFIQTIDKECGLFVLHDGAKNVKRLSETVYDKLTPIHNQAWLLETKAKEFELLVNEQIVLDKIKEAKAFNICDMFAVYHFRTVDKSYCLLVDRRDVLDGVDTPEDEADFTVWYYSMLAKYHRHDIMANTSVRSVMEGAVKAEFEVFANGNYEPIKIWEDDYDDEE